MILHLIEIDNNLAPMADAKAKLLANYLWIGE
jgi:hypothetical protein